MKRLTVFLLALLFTLAGCAPKTEAESHNASLSESTVTPALQNPAAVTDMSSGSDIDELPIEPAWTYPGSDNWLMTGQFGGTTKAMYRDGDRLYLGSGLHVLVLNVADPEAIEVMGTSPLLPQFVESISGDGLGHLFVSCGSGGMVILNVSNSSTPTISGYLDTMGYTENAISYGQYVILADGPQGVQIADVSDVQNPTVVSEAYSLAYVYDIAIKDTTVYAAGGGSGLFTVDLSDPKMPVEAGMIQLNGCQYDAEIVNERLYLAGAWGGVSAFDIGEPLSPKLVNNTETTGWAMALENADDDLLVLDGADGAMLYDLSSSYPELLSTFTLFGFVSSGAMEGNTVFLLDEEFGLVSVDYSDKSAPELLCRWMPLTEARRLTVNGTTAYVAGGLSGMHVIDLSDVGNPQEAFWYNTDGGYVNTVLVSGNKAYASIHLDTRNPLVIFDISNPLQPKDLGRVLNDEAVYGSAFRSFALGDEAAYIAGERTALTVDIRDSAHPKMTSRIDLASESNSGVTQNDLFVTGSRLQIYDVSDPQNLKLISSLDNNSSGEAVAFLDDTTVLCSGEPGIWIVDISDSRNPKKIGEFTMSGSPMGITMDGTTAYISALGNGVYIVDLSDINNPVLIETIHTLGDANSCYLNGNQLIVADSIAGMTIYERVSSASNADVATTGTKGYALTLLTGEDRQTTPYTPPDEMTTPNTAHEYVITTAADSGDGSLRNALEHLQPNTTITFDTTVFSPKKPATIALESALPEIENDYLTLDASNAGVILDGSHLSEGNGLTVRASHCTVMGLQIVNFPGNGIQGDGNWNQFGGSRAIGAGPIGQGNLASGNGICGIVTGGWYTKVLGNLVGTDITGTQAYPNYDGIFVTDWGFYVTVGSTNPDERNIASGNNSINMDSWGDHTRIIGNIIGLDITGTKVVKYDSESNLTLENTAKNTIVGGTTLEERNIISGAQSGVTFSDTTSYQNAVIGNYIGTDISGTKAVANRSGGGIWACSHHRIGGNAEGEGNLISGNENAGTGLSGYGCSDNFILGNRIGVDAKGNSLPNGTGIDVNTGQRHGTIGGYTPAEGNLIVGGSISMRITGRGIKGCYIAGNSVINPGNLMVYLEDGASDCFIQNNTFGENNSNAVRVDYGTGNIIRANTFSGEKPWDLILLLEDGNTGLPVPVVTLAEAENISGTTCAFGCVEVYLFGKTGIVSLGFSLADENGEFRFSNNVSLSGKQVTLLVTDRLNNTSAFTQPCTVS